MAPVGDIENAVEQKQRRALVLHRGVECQLPGFGRRRHVQRPACAGASIIEREREDQVLLGLATVGGGHGIDEHRLRGGIDGRGSGDAQRVDVSAGQGRLLNVLAQLLLPNHRTARGIECVDLVLLGGHQHQIFATRSTVDIEGLRVGRPHRGRLERGVHVKLGRIRFGECGVDVHSVARRVLVVLQHARSSGDHQAAASASNRSARSARTSGA